MLMEIQSGKPQGRKRAVEGSFIELEFKKRMFEGV
jgi:hypothetical protein